VMLRLLVRAALDAAIAVAVVEGRRRAWVLPPGLLYGFVDRRIHALRLLLLVDDALLLFVRLVAGHLALLCLPSSPTQRPANCCAASAATQQGRRGPAAVDIGDAQPFPGGGEDRHHFQPLVHGLALGRTG